VSLFGWMAQYKRIWVTGPQRSGTSITARMIAHDTGYAYQDGVPINKLRVEGLRRKQGSREGVVIQCPFAARNIDQIVEGDDQALVVFVYRNTDDIVKSQERIHWLDSKELDRYPGSTFKTLAKDKYAYWESVTRERVAHWHQVEYDVDLPCHPLWVGKQGRAGWEPRRWRSRGRARKEKQR